MYLLPRYLIAIFVTLHLLSGHCVQDGTDPDLPGFKGNVQLISNCSYLIPMDLEWQGGGGTTVLSTAVKTMMNAISNTDFNLRAYGIVDTLLWGDVPVKWAILTGKYHNEADFCTRTWELMPYPEYMPLGYDPNSKNVSGTQRCYKGGPFIIDNVYAEQAWKVIQNYTIRPTYMVRIHRFAVDTMVDIRYFIVNRPYVAIFTSSGLQQVLSTALDDAGFTFYKLLDKDQALLQVQNECLSMAMEPHFHSGDDSDYNNTLYSHGFVNAARLLVSLGSNFWAQCGGISTYEQCDNEDGSSQDTWDQGVIPPGAPRNSSDFLGYPWTGDPTTSPYTKYNSTYKYPLSFFFRPTYSGYRRDAPPYNASAYCPNGLFVTTNGLNFRPKQWEWDILNNQKVLSGKYDDLQGYYNATSTYFNEAPDCPIGQWTTVSNTTQWTFVSGSIHYLTLWNPNADGNNFISHLRQDNAAHWLVYQQSARDKYNDEKYPPYNNTLGPYYYSLHMGVHSKLEAFHGKTGGNIFFMAGHNGNTGTDDTHWNGCTGPPTVTASCQSLQARRMFMNAVMTPAYRTCSITVNGEKKSLTIDPSLYASNSTSTFIPIASTTGNAASFLSTTTIAEILLSSDPSSFRPSILYPLINGMGVLTVKVTRPYGPAYVTLSGVPYNSSIAVSNFAQILVQQINNLVPGGVDLSRFSVSIQNNVFMVVVDNHYPAPVVSAPVDSSENSSISTPTLSPTSPIKNMSDSTNYENNVQLPPDTCRSYRLIIGDKIDNVKMYVAIQTSTKGGVALTVYLAQNEIATDNSTADCVSPKIIDNNEFTIEWEDNGDSLGYFTGESVSIPLHEICTNKSYELSGTWYASICTTTSCVFSFQTTYYPTDVGSSQLLLGSYLVPFLAVISGLITKYF